MLLEGGEKRERTGGSLTHLFPRGTNAEALARPSRLGQKVCIVNQKESRCNEGVARESKASG